MNHRPFENWLLDDEPLNEQQKRELQAHLQNCSTCTGIAESNLSLHTTKVISPAAGFTERFRVRLAERRREQQWRQIAGTILLVLAGVGLLYWLAGPLIEQVWVSPASWITTMVSYFLFILTTVEVLSEASGILLRILPAFISPAGWLIISSLFAGLSLLWTFSMLRVARIPQGV